MIIIQLFILSIMCGAWGFLWNMFIEKSIPTKLPVWIKKPIGACLICTSSWWAMLVFLPLFIWLSSITWWVLLYFPIIGGVSASTSVMINYIARKTVLDKEYYDFFKQEQLSKNFQKIKPTV